MSRNKVRLRAPVGTDECNHSVSFGRPYRVNNDGIVEVDEEAVGPLLEKGGFTLADPEPVFVPDGSVRVRHVSDPTVLCSHRGESFGLEADGSVVVPIAAVPHLAAHGFVQIVDEPAIEESVAASEPVEVVSATAAPARIKAPFPPSARTE